MRKKSRMHVRPKKHLGQHFLKDESLAKRTADALFIDQYTNVLEIGPGTGVLTQFLIDKTKSLYLAEIDVESVNFLRERFPNLKKRILHVDFLKIDLAAKFPQGLVIVGNFPYNISAPIMFKVLEYRRQVQAVAGMFQKEVAERITAAHGSKKYGILSVLLQTFYETELLFTLDPEKFDPPPNVDSAVIKLRRIPGKELEYSESFFIRVVKTAFNQRRKMLRNSMKSMFPNGVPDHPFMTLRPEQLSPLQFEELALLAHNHKSS